MRISLRGSFRTLVCILAGLVLTQQASAVDDTNAALITDGTVWAQSMQQLMGGTSLTVSSSTIHGPAGIYANVRLSTIITTAQKLACPPPPIVIVDCQNNVGYYLSNYFLYVLENPAVSGLLLEAQWQDLSPVDPGHPPGSPDPSLLHLDYIGAAFSAISAWNKQHPAYPKTLQLELIPGFNSPAWLFNEIDTAAGGPGMGSCDPLFYSPQGASSSKCGYTWIFYRTESMPVTQLPLPLPWDPTYKSYWRAFLSAVSQYIANNPDYVSSFVSIAVAGPTASSTEIILPNGHGVPKTNPNAGKLTLPPSVCSGTPCSSAKVDVYQAWNFLLGNNYGATSSYVNSERAFIEEWAYAIDVYGQLFSGVTLTVATGGDQLPDFPSPSNPYLTHPPQAFVPDCGTSNIATMSCAAETAILAYFAGPPAGGANAKATQENGLTARGIQNLPLSGASVKWLSKNTMFPLSVLNPSSRNSSIVARMLGGLQFAQQFSDQTIGASGHSPMQYEGCQDLKDLKCTMTPEQALRNVLQAYFQGTVGATLFGTGSTMNGTEIVKDAPIDYLQIWDADILYAAGLRSCTTPANLPQLMSQPPIKGKPPKCHENITATAQDLLDLASWAILNYTQEPVTYPKCGCPPAYPVPRNAFLGDAVCVTQTEQTQAATDNNIALKPPGMSNYSTDYTAPPVPPYTELTQSIPYGICRSSIITTANLFYRQAYMGDYVCVSLNQLTQVADDNAAFPARVQLCSPPPQRFPPPWFVLPVVVEGPITPAPGVPVEEVAGEVVLNAVISAIDTDNLLLTVTGPVGNTITLKAAPEVLNRVTINEPVTIRYADAVVTGLRKAGATPRSDSNEPNTIELAATVAGVDYGNRTVTFQHPNETLRTIKAGPGVRGLDAVQRGDRVVMLLTRPVAIDIRPRAVSAAPFEPGINRLGADYRSFSAPGGPRDCQAACGGDDQCRAWTYVREGIQGPSARCWLKESVPPPTRNDCCVSGVMR